MRLIRKTRHQEIWEHNGKTYSLVDQYKLPDQAWEAATSFEAQEALRRVEELLRSPHSPIWGPQRYEVAELADSIKVRGRYASKKEARARIASGEVDNDRSFWS